MPLALLTALVLTDKPARLGGPIADSFRGSPGMLVADVQVAGAGSVLLYRWSDDFALWVPHVTGAAAIAGAGTVDTRWDLQGIGADYCMKVTGTTGSWSPRQGSV
jgi:hypothetical protein